MRQAIVAMALLIVAASICGCKTKAVSRTFDAGMEKTWAAVVSVSEQVSKEKPNVDVVNRKVVTGWVYQNLRAQPEQGPVVRRSTDVWRGVITCKAEGQKTKVTIKLQRGGLVSEENSAGHTPSDNGVSVVLSSNEIETQDKFLAKVAEELAKGK